ncbi:hypothetical protein AAE02nite_06070 [Adhaeribacter aerolatus]|uniref:Uncharacterized protein n=1 Tax=Adhaeribacter aerolatus TaxID=670289 RepID=A0A512ATC5_9BACT|nr:hypothetical protein [Adhaeribacter aerolatus]GEO02943.1 hypothetical protein AAE02nite_06070 [Adhaeribacter aerolatus]
MKKISLILLLAGAIYLPACSGEKTSTTTESESAEADTANDSSTTNPINSEYGTPNSSENPTDSAQSANKSNNQ